MNQILRLFASLSLRQRISLGVAVAAVAAGLAWFVHWNTERDFQLLYSNLSAEDAAAVVGRLKETASDYRLSADGSTINVRAGKVAELRLEMAGAGLPKSGRIGYELFDKTTFGATEFAEQVNYHRALEGELERSMLALAEVEQARVHVTQPKESLFLENRRPAKASVLLKIRAGAQLSAHNVQAVTHLVASAVEGLTPEMVSVLDVRGNLLNRPRREQGGESEASSEGALDYRRGMERDLLAKINSTLEPLLGEGNYRAGISVECDFSSGEQSEETFDPARSVMTSSQRTEDVAGAGEAGGGVPGTASNLPRPAARPASGSQGVTRRSENIGYQTSRVVKHLRLPQGAVKRMSVAVLLDHRVRWEGQGEKARRIVEAPTPERLKSTRDLIAGVVGLQPERGDQLTVESLPFESTLSWEPPAARPAAPAPGSIEFLKWLQEAWLRKDKVVLGALGGGLAVLLLGAGFLVYLRRRGRGKGLQGTAGTALGKGAATPALPEGPSLEDKIEQKMANQLASRQKQEQDILSSLNLKLPSSTSQKAEILVKQLGEEAKKDKTTLPQVVRTWMSDLES